MSLLLLSRDDVTALLRTDMVMAALADGFRALSSGKAEVPGRTRVVVPTGALLTMPAAMPAAVPAMPIGVKLVSVFEGNHGTDLPSHQAVICLFDSENGRPLALLDGTHITAVRTAGAAMLAIDNAVRVGARTAVVVGSGVQAQAHATMLIDRFEEVLLYGRNAESAGELVGQIAGRLGGCVIQAMDLQVAVEDADVVCLCTHGYEPVIESSWVRRGAVVTSVGFAPPGHELPLELVDRASAILVESRSAFEPSPVGCTELAGRDAAKGIELGEILLGLRQARSADDDIVVYKSMGHAIEDVVTAAMVYEVAIAQGRGREIDW